MIRVAEIWWGQEYEFSDRANATRYNRKGIYQIIENWYGTSRRLIYIGISKEGDSTIKIRIEKHRQNWLNEIWKNQIFVRFGTINLLTRGRVTPQLIEDVESVLIFQTQPPQNWAKKHSYQIDEDLIVKNKNGGPYLPTTIKSVSHTG